MENIFNCCFFKFGAVSAFVDLDQDLWKLHRVYGDLYVHSRADWIGSGLHGSQQRRNIGL